jgi:DNA polymerase I-like protein with 3'-5' exonuclease and polymerase domains
MLIALDFETYYDKDYTLRKLSTSEYVRDSRFEAISCAVKVNKGKTKCWFGDDIKKCFADIDWSKATLLAHHTHFDGLILTHHYGHVPAQYADTLSMGRALHSKSQKNSLDEVTRYYGVTNKLAMPDFKGKHLADLTDDEKKAIAAYNCTDVEGMYEVYQKMLEKFPPGELYKIHITCRMFCEPVLRVDLKMAKKELQEERERKVKAIENSGVDEKVLASTPKFVAELEKLGVDIPMKPSPSVKDKMIPAMAKSDDELQEMLYHKNPKVVALVEGRLAAKSTLSESKAERMILRGRNKMRLPIYLNYAGAHTFRWSGGDKFNPQNFKQGHKVGGGLKKAIMSPANDEVIVVVDASQIECRITAWMFDQEDLLQGFRDKRDIYCEFASDAYGRTITKADEEERFVGKTCVLGLGFHMGGPRLQFSLLTKSIEQGMEPVRLPLDVCYGLVHKFRTKYSKISSGWKMLNNYGIGAMISGKPYEFKSVKFVEGAIELPSGLSLKYPELRGTVSDKLSPFFKGVQESLVTDASYLGARHRVKLHGGIITENIAQSLARIHVADCMEEIDKVYRVVTMEHDAVGYIAKKKDAQKALDYGIKIMSQSPFWAPDIPLFAEGKFDVRYPK